jgi:peptidoglycan/xylan/chitin deacetylase (PgdA/CDA1 family)
MTALRSALLRLRHTPHGVPVAAAAVLLAVLTGLALGAGGSGVSKTNVEAAIVSPAESGAARREAAWRDRRAIERTLRLTPYVARGSPDRREIALTFDDGPGPDTLRIMRVLRRLGAPATFFFVGQQADVFGRVLREEHARDFAIGNHTQNHAPLGRLRAPAQRRQLLAAAQRGRRYGVEEMRYFRPPYGSYNAATFEVARRLGLLMVLWSVDTGDYRRPGVNAIVHAAVRRARPGGIILMHDGGGPRRQTVHALAHVVHQLRRRGFRLVTVPEMLADAPAPQRQRPPPGIDR